MYNGSTRQKILQEVLERLKEYGLKVNWTYNGKELARVQNVSVDNPNRLSKSYTASVSQKGNVVLWNENRIISFPEYVQRVIAVMGVEDRRIEELLTRFSEDNNVGFLGSEPEKIKTAFERIKGYQISDEVAYKLREYGVMVLLRESLEDDMEFIRNSLRQNGYQEVEERLFRVFTADPKEFILVPMKNGSEITGFYVRWRVYSEDDPKHYYIKVADRLCMKLGNPNSKRIVLTEGVIDALIVHVFNPGSMVLMRAGWKKVLDELFYGDEKEEGKGRNKRDFDTYELILAFDKDKAGEGFDLEVVKRYGFVKTYEWTWEGNEDIDEVLIRGDRVEKSPAVKYYLKAFMEEIKDRIDIPLCVRLWIESEDINYNLSEDELKVLLGLFPDSEALKNYNHAFGINVGKIKYLYSYCSSGLLSRYCPLQNCKVGQGIIVGKLELEAVEPTEKEYRISVYRVEEGGEIEQEILYTKLKDLEKDITGTAGLLKLKEPVKSIAMQLLGKQARQIAKGLKDTKEDFVGDRLRAIIKDVLRGVMTYELKEDCILVSYAEFTELAKAHPKYKRGDIKEMERKKMIKKTTKLEGETIKHVYAVPKEFTIGLETKYMGHTDSLEENLKTYMHYIATREEITSGEADRFVEKNLMDILDELRNGKMVMITTGEEGFTWFSLEDMSEDEVYEYTSSYRKDGIYYFVVAMRNGVIHTIDRLERPTEIVENDIGEELGF
ncbi:MAG: hypothetical protein QXT86_13935 [Archaeoglobaceae archaeon]